MNEITTKVQGDDLRIGVPITKIDREKRLVSGFATLDNIDKQGHLVLPEASQKAFDRFRGNIREMHMPLAVGRMVGFRRDTLYDEETQKTYEGIYVTARVSKGAQDTWEKVLDGTLSGFSIGGYLLEREDAYDEEGNKYQIIKDYELVELSLVDNPANQLANVFSIQKVNGSLEVTGFAIEDDTDESNELDSVVEKFFNRLDEFIKTQIGGNNTMATETEKVDTVEDAEEVETVSEEVSEEVVEKADTTEVEETVEAEETEELDIEAIVETAVTKALEGFTKNVEADDEVSEEEVTEEVTDAVADAVEKAIGEVAESLKSLTDGLTAVAKRFADLEGTLDTRLDALEKSTALKKSADFSDSDDDDDKTNFWGGTFTGGTANAE